MLSFHLRSSSPFGFPRFRYILNKKKKEGEARLRSEYTRIALVKLVINGREVVPIAFAARSTRYVSDPIHRRRADPAILRSLGDGLGNNF